MTKQKIAKVLSHRGVASRRLAEELVKQGRVRLNGVIINNVAETIDPNADLMIDNKILPQLQDERIWIFNKPRGYITSRHDPNGRPTIYELLPPELSSLHYIGRLDYNTEGLLLLTNSPPLKQRFEHPSNELPRQYSVRIFGRLNDNQLKQIQQPLIIDGISYKPLKIISINAERNHAWLKVIIFEGKNREIRRIFEHFNCQVSRLIRTHYGQYCLSDYNLATGGWCFS